MIKFKTLQRDKRFWGSYFLRGVFFFFVAVAYRREVSKNHQTQFLWLRVLNNLVDVAAMATPPFGS